jgi:hypothetical protein
MLKTVFLACPEEEQVQNKKKKGKIGLIFWAKN